MHEILHVYVAYHVFSICFYLLVYEVMYGNVVVFCFDFAKVLLSLLWCCLGYMVVVFVVCRFMVV